MGLANLPKLDEVIAANRRNYQAYAEALDGIPGLSLLRYDENERNNYQYVVLEVAEDCPASRDRLVEALRAENIMARRYFWPGCHRMEPYRSLFPHAGLVLPATEAVANRVIVLPTGQTMDADMVQTVVQVIRTVVQHGA